MAEKKCGCCCSLLSLLKIIIIVTFVIFILALAILIFWLILHPNRVELHLTDVTLSRFNLIANNTLLYNLTISITAHNPNKKIGIYYDRIEASVLYANKRFDTKMLTPFYQGRKKDSYLRFVFEGQRLVLLGAKELSKFYEEKKAGLYSVDLKVYMIIRYKVAKIKVGKFKPIIECEFKLPLAGANDTSARGTKANCSTTL